MLNAWKDIDLSYKLVMTCVEERAPVRHEELEGSCLWQVHIFWSGDPTWLWDTPNHVTTSCEALGSLNWKVTSKLHTKSFSGMHGTLCLRNLKVWGIYTLTFPRITQKLTAGRSGAGRIFRLPGPRTYMVKYIFIYIGLQLKYKLQHTETWSAAGRQPHRLHYRPAIFSHRGLLITLSLPQGKSSTLLTHWGQGNLNCLNARSRGF